MDSKVYMFPENNNGLLSLIGPLLSLRGIDPSVLLAMNKNGYGEGSWFIWVIFLFFLMGWGNFGGRSGEMINSDAGRELLMSAIQGNQGAISQLATTLNCDINAVQTAINAVMMQVLNVGNQVGLSTGQVINAIQAGNSTIASQLANCCCENRLAIANQTSTLLQAINSVATGQERGFSSTAYATQQQTCDLLNTIKDSTSQILAGQRAAEMREMLDKIDTLRELNSQKDVVINNGQQTAIVNQMIQLATAPLGVALNTLQTEISGLKCRLPESVNVPYSPVVGIPSCVAALYGLNPYSYGFWG